MIILEGADLVGKSTLAAKLCHKLSKPYEHLGPLPPDFHTYWSYMLLMKNEPVMDRFHWSEWAYSYARQDETRQSIYEKKLVEAALHELGAVSVLVRTNWDNIRARYDDKEMYDIPTIQRAYAWFEMHQSEFDVVINAQPYPTTQDCDLIVEKYRSVQEERRNLINSQKIYIHN